MPFPALFFFLNKGSSQFSFNHPPRHCLFQVTFKDLPGDKACKQPFPVCPWSPEHPFNLVLTKDTEIKCVYLLYMNNITIGQLQTVLFEFAQCLACYGGQLLFLPSQHPYLFSFGSGFQIFLSSCGLGRVASILWLQGLANNSDLVTRMLIPLPYRDYFMMFQKVTQPRSMGISIRTSDETTREGRPSSCQSYSTGKKSP